MQKLTEVIVFGEKLSSGEVQADNFDAVQDALIAGYEQNQDFFALLLDNDEKKRELMQVFLEDVYKNLRE